MKSFMRICLMCKASSFSTEETANKRLSQWFKTEGPDPLLDIKSIKLFYKSTCVRHIYA